MYFDNASTSSKKPSMIYDRIKEELFKGCSPSRGGYDCSLNTSRKLYQARKSLARLFKIDKASNVIFTPGATWSLNTAILGLIDEGDHLIISGIEHNAVMRPIKYLQKTKNVTFSVARHDHYGRINLGSIESLINSKTKAIIINHASNVNGIIMPLKKIGDIAKKHNLYYIVDVAQTAGFLDIDFEKTQTDVLAFTGHKALMGPPGTGGMVLSDRAGVNMKPLIYGGTGSMSESFVQPDNLPDKFESGTMNFPGFITLGASVDYISEIGLSAIRKHEYKMLKTFKDGLNKIANIITYHDNGEDYVPTVSFTLNNKDVSDISFILARQYGVMTRSGLHCAPQAHKTLNSYETGTIRVSLGYYNTEEEIMYLLESLQKVAK